MNELIFFLISLLIIFVIFYKSVSNKFLLLYVVFLPFRFTLFSFNGIEIRITDFIALILILLFFFERIFFPKRNNFENNIFTNFIVIFIIIIIISFFFNYFRLGYFGTLIDLVRILFVLTLSYSVFFIFTPKLIFPVLIFWTLSASIISIASLISLYSNGFNIGIIFSINNLELADFYFLKFSTSVFFEDPNNYASYLLISFFISLHLFIFKSKFFLPLSFIILLGITVSLSRSAYFGLVFSAFFYFIYFLIFKTRFLIFKTFIFLTILVSSYFFLFSVIDDNSALSRIDLWLVGLRMFFDNLILGVGIGGSKYLFDIYISNDLLVYNPYFHNLYIHIGAELGLISLVIFLFFIFKTIKIDSLKSSSFGHFLFIAIISFLIQSTAVEYFASRHFWFFLAFYYYYKSQSSIKILPKI